MGKKIQVFRSKLIPGAYFSTAKEAMEAEDKIRERQREDEVYEAIGSFNRTSPSMDMAKEAGPDAWSQGRSMGDIQKISEGQVMNEMYGNKLGAARGYGITQNPSEPANRFMENLNKEETQRTREEKTGNKLGLGGWAQRSKDWDEISNMPEGEEKESAKRNYLYKWAPSVGYSSSPEAITQATEKAVSVGEATLPVKAATAAATSSAGTRAKIETEFETQKRIPGSFKSSQYLAGNYAIRINQAERVLDELQTKGYDPGSFYNKIKSADALNAIKDPEQRQYAQAMRNFINATLRRESGAAIAPHEFDSANKQYFAQLGDDAKTLAQKAENRNAVYASFKAEAGGAYEQILSETKKPEKKQRKVWNPETNSFELR